MTRSFEFPIPRCADSIEDFGDFSGRIYFISFNARSGYHQIRVRRQDQEKLASFTPSGEKKTFEVIPFGPKNAPAFYTAMMQFLYADLTVLLNKTKHTINLSNSPTIIICNDRIIIDDIFFSNHIPTLLLLFSCVAQVFTKFRISFKLSKCDFLKDRVEDVGHDLTADGNCPAASKFSLLQDWPLPPHGISLLSSIGLRCF